MKPVYWLLASLALVIAPHLAHLPLWVGPLCLGLGAWRVAAERGRVALPGKPLLIALTAACTALILAEFHTLFGRDAGVTLLVVMISLKLMEMKTRRDILITVFLAYFLVAAGFLYSQAIPMVLYLLLAVWTITTTMIAYGDTASGLATRARMKLGAVLLLQAMPLMLVLFVLFPRVSPLWSLPQDAHSGVSGLSDSMSPGTISQLIQSEAVAFRVNFSSPLPPAQTRYWRGPVLWDYDGRTWSTRTPSPESASLPLLRGGATTYVLTLEPHHQRWLFALDLPATLPPDSRAAGDMQILAREPVERRLRYQLTSYIDYRLGAELVPSARQRALTLPANLNPRTHALAGRWRSDEGSDPAVVARALAHFREQNFVYTLSPPRLGTQAVDSFLFETKRGFCEHYAGAFVTLMRAAGIPARVVTGYQGGSLNPLGDYLVVRQSDAHAWAEVWLAERGWVRVDPTAAVSPDRVEQGIAAALPAAELPLALARLDIAWLQRMQQTWDLVNSQWDLWVLGYGEDRQRSLLARIHASLATWAGMAVALAALLLAGLAGVALYLLWQAAKNRADPAQAAYARFCRRLARLGIARLPHEGPLDFSRRAGQARPALATRISHITQLYLDLRYRRNPPPLRALRQAVRRFRP